MKLRWSPSENLQRVADREIFNQIIRPMHLDVRFLHQHPPHGSAVLRLGKAFLDLALDRELVINHEIIPSPIHEQFHDIEPVGVLLEQDEPGDHLRVFVQE